MAAETQWCDVVNKISTRQSFCWKRYGIKNVYISIEKYICGDIEFDITIP
jgi:hypothetical protein